MKIHLNKSKVLKLCTENNFKDNLDIIKFIYLILTRIDVIFFNKEISCFSLYLINNVLYVETRAIVIRNFKDFGLPTFV